MATLKLFFLRLSAALYIGCGGYAAWSWVYRLLWEWKFRDVTKLRIFATLADLGAYLQANASKWTGDTLKQGFDAFSFPLKAQRVFDGEEADTRGIDCDEFACFAANAILQSTLKGKMPAEVYSPQILTVTWVKKADGKATGHNVCLVEMPNGKRAYMDYGQPAGHSSNVEGVVRAVLDRYAPGGWQCIGWCTMTPALREAAFHWGLAAGK